VKAFAGLESLSGSLKSSCSKPASALALVDKGFLSSLDFVDTVVGDESYCFDTDNNQTIYTFIRSMKLLLVLAVAQESIMIDATVTAAAAALQTCCPLLPIDLISTTQLSAAGYSFAFK
jgi:hypothetical protein